MHTGRLWTAVAVAWLAIPAIGAGVASREAVGFAAGARAGTGCVRRGRGDEAVPAKGQLPGVSRLGGRRPQDGQPDAGRREPARDASSTAPA